MLKKVLITGITGFAGSHLAEYLISKTNYEIFGTYLSDKSIKNVAKILDLIHLEQIDLLHTEDILSFISSVKPDLLFHLAALPAVGSSFKNPSETITNNIVAELNVLEAVKNANLQDCRILIVSSADVYGKVSEKDLPIDEDTPFTPTNTYAVSKIAQDFLGFQYFISYNLKIIRARPFNHIGPRQSLGFVVSDWAQKIAKIEKGKIKPVLSVGNLNAERDFTSVKDMVRAYSLLIEKGIIGEVYNIGSGISYKISDILHMLVSLSTAKIAIETDKELLRPEDALKRVCDNRKIVKLTEWKPTISIEQTLKDTLDYWRNIV